MPTQTEAGKAFEYALVEELFAFLKKSTTLSDSIGATIYDHPRGWSFLSPCCRTFTKTGKAVFVQ